MPTNAYEAYQALAQQIPQQVQNVTQTIQRGLTGRATRQVGQQPTVQAQMEGLMQAEPFPGAVNFEDPMVKRQLMVAQMQEKEDLKNRIIGGGKRVYDKWREEVMAATKGRINLPEMPEGADFETSKMIWGAAERILLQDASDIASQKRAETMAEAGLGRLGAGQQIQQLRPTAPEAKAMGAVRPTVDNLKRLTDMYFDHELHTKVSNIPDIASKLPWIGRYIAPKAKIFNNSKRILSEDFLRAATGAAAPDKEVKTYMGFMWDIGDPIPVGRTKAEDFVTRVKGKANEYASRQEILGNYKAAEKARREVDRLASELMTHWDRRIEIYKRQLETARQPDIPAQVGGRPVVSAQQGETEIPTPGAPAPRTQGPPPGSAQNPIPISNDDEFDQLSKGDYYKGPDGKVRVK